MPTKMIHCNLCGAKSEGSEGKVKLWTKLHFKTTHPTREIISAGMQESIPCLSSRRYFSKDDETNRQKAQDKLVNILCGKN